MTKCANDNIKAKKIKPKHIKRTKRANNKNANDINEGPLHCRLCSKNDE